MSKKSKDFRLSNQRILLTYCHFGLSGIETVKRLTKLLESKNHPKIAFGVHPHSHCVFTELYSSFGNLIYVPSKMPPKKPKVFIN